MKRAFTMSSALILMVLLLVVGGCRSSNGDLNDARTQRRFGVSMAKMNLWREAMFRFRRAAEIDPKNAMAHNNLAVAYEATGDFDAAAREYREALRLDRANQYIQKNYSRFVEFTQKGKKRQPKAATAAAKPAHPTSNAPATAASPAPASPPLPPPTMPTAGDASPNPPTTTTNPPGEGF
jgi:Tfp pilus assembly protein PilF